MQQHLLDQHRPPAGPLDVVARTHAAKVVGGDYYDFIPLDDQRFAVAVADVSGKGLPAALIMPAVKIALRTLAERQAPIGELLGELNRIFLDNLPPASYFTLVYGVFDAAAGRLVYANAGHPPTLHLKAPHGEEAWLRTEGPAVGLLHEDVQFDTVEVPFGPGRRLRLLHRRDHGGGGPERRRLRARAARRHGALRRRAAGGGDRLGGARRGRRVPRLRPSR